ncbi:MAG: rhomboid family intramembrane serine protease [Deltaproteobacteria bacterium]|jgi:membrane associated rhomboid family serine protease|nr:MAG: rhomboid family intramembrane serine protease [Deltaproteobacteria bacterium]
MMFGGGVVPPAVKFLLIVNTAVFFLQLFLPTQFLILFGLVPALVWEDFYLWQLFTYQFLHGGLLHLLFNMFALWMFGCDLERRWGSEFFLKYYFVSVVGGGILNTLFLPGQVAPSIGASAGIYGILLAYGLIYPNQIVYFYFLFPIKMKHFVWIIGAIALYSAIASGQSGIAHLAHLGGMVFGYLYLRGGNPWDRFKLYLDQRRLARLRRRFQVVQGKRDDDTKPTLH